SLLVASEYLIFVFVSKYSKLISSTSSFRCVAAAEDGPLTFRLQPLAITAKATTQKKIYFLFIQLSVRYFFIDKVGFFIHSFGYLPLLYRRIYFTQLKKNISIMFDDRTAGVADLNGLL